MKKTIYILTTIALLLMSSVYAITETHGYNMDDASAQSDGVSPGVIINIKGNSTEYTLQRIDLYEPGGLPMTSVNCLIFEGNGTNLLYNVSGYFNNSLFDQRYCEFDNNTILQNNTDYAIIQETLSAGGTWYAGAVNSGATPTNSSPFVYWVSGIYRVNGLAFYENTQIFSVKNITYENYEVISPSQPLPVIVSFTTTNDTILNGSTTFLEWNTTDADDLDLNGANLTGLSNFTTNPLTTTTTFTLTATNTNGSVNANLTINIYNVETPPVQNETHYEATDMGLAIVDLIAGIFVGIATFSLVIGLAYGVNMLGKHFGFIKLK